MGFFSKGSKLIFGGSNKKVFFFDWVGVYIDVYIFEIFLSYIVKILR